MHCDTLQLLGQDGGFLFILFRGFVVIVLFCLVGWGRMQGQRADMKRQGISRIQICDVKFTISKEV